MDRTERVELTTLVMVTDGQGRMLVQDRKDPDWGGISFPGGHVERDESFVQSAIREVYEETGLTIEAPRLCGIKQFPIDGGRYLVLFFKTDRYSGTLHDSEEGPVFWVRPDELENYRLTDRFREMVEIFFSDEKTEFIWFREEDQWQYKIL